MRNQRTKNKGNSAALPWSESHQGNVEAVHKRLVGQVLPERHLVSLMVMMSDMHLSVFVPRNRLHFYKRVRRPDEWKDADTAFLDVRGSDDARDGMILDEGKPEGLTNGVGDFDGLLAEARATAAALHLDSVFGRGWDDHV